MSNEENLKKGVQSQFNNMTPEQRREYGRQGGISSGRSKRTKKQWSEVAEYLLGLPVNDGKKQKISSIKSAKDLVGKNIDIQAAIIVGIVKKALKGDVKAAIFLRDTMGQNPHVLAKKEITSAEEKNDDSNNEAFASMMEALNSRKIEGVDD